MRHIAYRLRHAGIRKVQARGSVLRGFRRALLILTLLTLCAELKADPQTNVPLSIVSPLGRTMQLKFHDEFDAVPDKDGCPYIDRTKWQTTFWQGSGERTLLSNLEAQYYTDKDYTGRGEAGLKPALNPFSFEKPGILTISAAKAPKEVWPNFWMNDQRCFTSGLLISDGRFTFKYGYIEGRFKLPASRGAWPAFWLLSDEPSLGGPAKAHEWPPEIDIFEFMGHWTNKFDSTLITTKGRSDRVNDWTLRYHQAGFDISKDFHSWGCEWSAQEVVFVFDGKIWARGKTPPSMRRSMYILINLAVGGKWYSEEMSKTSTPCKPWEVDESSMPWKLECDYVRVYQ
jgi:beta-glucanase (GH16 family)